MDDKKEKQYLTAEHFYKFFQCPHWIWYDIYGDQRKKGDVPPLMQMIFEDGLAHEEEALKKMSQPFDEIKPDSYKDLDEAYRATLELMKQGKNIYHGILMDGHWVGIPDLLEVRPTSELAPGVGRSKFGDYYYAVYDIKSSKEIKPENKFQLAFYSLILERIQGILPPYAYIINAEGEEKAFLVDDFLDEFDFTKEKIEKILEGEKPAPFLKGGCKRSPWYSICLEDTEGCQDISLIHRIKQGEQKRLYDQGIRTVKDMADIDIDELRSNLSDWPYDKLVRFQNQAKTLLSNEPVILKKTEFPEVETEIYFDAEGDPTNGIDYMFGVLTRKDGKEGYKYFWAKDKDDEERMWKEFLDFLIPLESFVIYHYAPYEIQVFNKMVKKYGAPEEVISKFKDNTIDLYTYAVEGAVLPLYFYGLKDVAGFLGYQWQAKDAGGAESVVWYNEWLKTGDKKIKEKIVKYNEDDVRATALVKDWLIKQKPKKVREKLE